MKVGNDWFLVANDFASYLEAQEDVDKVGHTAGSCPTEKWTTSLRCSPVQPHCVGMQDKSPRCTTAGCSRLLTMALSCAHPSTCTQSCPTCKGWLYEGPLCCLLRLLASGLQGPGGWTRRSIMYTAGSGKFSSDRTIVEYAKDIWHVTPLRPPSSN